MAVMRVEFQSTHPVRGATEIDRLIMCYRVISIHAPRAGCDLGANGVMDDIHTFQSTHPVRGATATPSAPMRSA